MLRLGSRGYELVWLRRASSSASAAAALPPELPPPKLFNPDTVERRSDEPPLPLGVDDMVPPVCELDGIFIEGFVFDEVFARSLRSS